MKTLLNFFIKPKKKTEPIYLIIQWGTKRSIIQNFSNVNNPLIIIDNETLMVLDERGKILT